MISKWKKPGIMFKSVSIVTILCMSLGTFIPPGGAVFADENNSPFTADKEINAFVKAKVKPYTVKKDLSNVANIKKFEIPASSKKLLSKNGFVVESNSWKNEFFEVYENNRYDSVPNFITTDSMLHTYHLYFSFLLKNLEKGKLGSELKSLTKGMLDESIALHKSLKGTSWENAAKRNMAYFSVAASLLEIKFDIPSEVKREVLLELSAIEKHNSTGESYVINMGYAANILNNLKEDYTQYIPRGHYAGDNDLEAYFKAMMWYGRMTFRTKEADEARSALLLAFAVQNKDNLQSWNKINDTTAFFAGESDDPGNPEITDLIKTAYGEIPSTDKVKSDTASWDKFYALAKTIKGPAINSIPIFDETLQPDREKEIKGFRFMGQRYSLDADIFQRLIYRDVKENSKGQRRMLPMSLDVPAAFGSTEAQKILKDMKQYDYENYPENMKKLQAQIKSFDKSQWQKNLYTGWLDSLMPLTETVKGDYPKFMKNQAWARKSLTTFIGSFTELKHDTVLYSKQVYAEMGAGPVTIVDQKGYVEPNSKVYAKLYNLSSATRKGLKSMELLDSRDEKNLKLFETLAYKLYTISEKELSGKSLTKAEYELIRTYGGQLEHIWLESLRDKKNTNNNDLLHDNPASLVTDVATGNGKVLQIANGHVMDIYAIVPVNGKLVLAKGGVFSNYEFTSPDYKRMTDSKWRELINSGKTPKAPKWTSLYTTTKNIMLNYPE